MTQSTDTFSFPDNELKVLEFWREQNIFQQTLDKTADGPGIALWWPVRLQRACHITGTYWPPPSKISFHAISPWTAITSNADLAGIVMPASLNTKSTNSLANPLPISEQQGIKVYNQACRNIVQRYAGDWRHTVERIGRWVDFDNDYKTMNLDFMESVWWVFKQLWEQDLIYQGTKVVPFSTALGTGLSNFEAGSNYQDVQDPAITVLLKLNDEPHHLVVGPPHRGRYRATWVCVLMPISPTCWLKPANWIKHFIALGAFRRLTKTPKIGNQRGSAWPSFNRKKIHPTVWLFSPGTRRCVPGGGRRFCYYRWWYRPGSYGPSVWWRRCSRTQCCGS